MSNADLIAREERRHAEHAISSIPMHECVSIRCQLAAALAAAECLGDIIRELWDFPPEHSPLPAEWQETIREKFGDAHADALALVWETCR